MIFNCTSCERLIVYDGKGVGTPKLCNACARLLTAIFDIIGWENFNWKAVR